MKRFITLTLSMILLVSFSATTSFAARQSNLDAYNVSDHGIINGDGGNMQFYLDGQDFYGDYFLKNGTTYMKLRDVGEEFGIEFRWNSSNKEVSFNIPNKKVRLYLDSTTAYVNDNKIKLASAPIIVNERTYLPLRAISELLGINVNYLDIRPLEAKAKEVIFKRYPDLREIRYNKRAEINASGMRGYTTYYFEADSYSHDDNTLSLHVYQIVEYPDVNDVHTATTFWFSLDLDTGVITNIMNDEYIGALKERDFKFMTR